MKEYTEHEAKLSSEFIYKSYLDIKLKLIILVIDSPRPTRLIRRFHATGARIKIIFLKMNHSYSFHWQSLDYFNHKRPTMPSKGKDR